MTVAGGGQITLDFASMRYAVAPGLTVSTGVNAQITNTIIGRALVVTRDA